MARGDWGELAARPLTLLLVLVGAAVLIGPAQVAAWRRRRAVPGIA